MATGSFETIRIHRSIPVVAGRVQIPPNKENYKDRVTILEARTRAIEEGFSVTVTRIGVTGGHSTAGGFHGVQEFIELPGVGVNDVDTNYNNLIRPTSGMSGQEY